VIVRIAGNIKVAATSDCPGMPENMKTVYRVICNLAGMQIIARDFGPFLLF
jgi:hypothetical protein